MRLRTHIGVVLAGNSLLGLLLMLVFWGRSSHLQEQGQLQGEASLFAKDVESFRNSVRFAVRITDLALVGEDMSPGESAGFGGSTYLAREALSNIEDVSARLDELQESTGSPFPLLLSSIEASIERLHGVVQGFLQSGPLTLRAGVGTALDERVMHVAVLVDQLATEVNLAAAEISRSVEQERKRLQQIGVLAAMGYVLCVALSWLWVSNRAIVPLQNLTDQARTAHEHGLPMHLEKSGPSDVVDLVQSVGRLVDHLQDARTQLEARVEERTASLSKVEGELERKEYELLQSQKMEAIGRLAGGVAHDFNNLLTVVMGCAELLQQQVKNDEAASENVDQICQAADRAASLTRQLLLFSRKQPAKTERFDFNTVLTGVEDMLSRLLGEGIRIEMNLTDNSCPIEGDRAQIESVIINLAVNARDAMPGGGGLVFETSLHEHLTSDSLLDEQAAPAGAVRLVVSDDGFGMEQALIARIFEPFFSTKPQSQGSGLGLSTVYGIVTRSGGSITVDSRPGEGTRFTLEFPSCSSTDSESRPVQAASVSSGGSERVLYVEDHPAQRKLFSNALRLRGYQVSEARTGDEALALIESGDAEFDLLVTDYCLPGASGTDVARSACARFPGIRVLCVTGSLDLDTPESSNNGVGGVADAGAAGWAPDHVFRKPFTPSQLCEKIRELLDG